MAVCLLWGFRHPEHERRPPSRLRGCSGRRARVHLARDRRRVPRVRAAGHDGGRRRPLPPAAPLPAQPHRARAGGGPARAGDHALQRRRGRRGDRRRARLVDGALGSRGRRRGRRAGGRAGRRTRAPWAWTWAAPRATCRWWPAAAWRSPAGARWAGARWRCRWSTCTPWAPAAAASPGATRAARCVPGPRSAGADPGPACYGRGGTEPTVTDANLLLGYLDAGSSLAGGVELDRDAAERAVGALAVASWTSTPRDAPPGSCAWRAPRWPRRCGW